MSKFEKGKSGNPKGRPRKVASVTLALQEIADPKELARRLLDLSKTDFNALRYCIDRLDGKPVETIKPQEIKGIQLMKIDKDDEQAL